MTRLTTLKRASTAFSERHPESGTNAPFYEQFPLRANSSDIRQNVLLWKMIAHHNYVVHSTGETLCVFRPFAWLEVSPTLKAPGFFMNPTIILIGPLGAGKSTVGRLLAEKLGLPQCSLDDLRWGYFEEIGYDKELASKLFQTGKDIPEKLSYGKTFEVHAIERVLADHSHSVIDFGASNSVYEEQAQFERVAKALAPYPNVILLLPSPDPEVSVRILNTRLIRIVKAKGEEVKQELFDLNEYFIRHPSNHQLAKMVIYTKDKTPEEICDEILGKLVDVNR